MVMVCDLAVTEHLSSNHWIFQSLSSPVHRSIIVNQTSSLSISIVVLGLGLNLAAMTPIITVTNAVPCELPAQADTTWLRVLRPTTRLKVRNSRVVLSRILNSMDVTSVNNANLAPYEYICPLITMAVRYVAMEIAMLQASLDRKYTCFDSTEDLWCIKANMIVILGELHEIKDLADTLESTEEGQALRGTRDMMRDGYALDEDINVRVQVVTGLVSMRVSERSTKRHSWSSTLLNWHSSSSH